MEKVKMAELWALYGGFCRALARKNAWMLQADTAIDFEDLVHTAFFGLMKAAETFCEGKGKTFAGWAAWYIVREFQQLLGWMPGRERKPHLYAQSLDVPAYDDDSEETALDLIADESIPDAADALEADDLEKAVSDALDRLQIPHAREVLRGKFFERRTRAQIAAQEGLTASDVQNIQSTAMRALRRDRAFQKAAGLYDAMPSYGTGFGTFTVSGSATERGAMWIVEQKERRNVRRNARN